jgi:hypothetical protein
MKHKYCCDASRDMVLDYYTRQSGGGVPYFEGFRGQRGHGLGSLLSGLWRSAVPILKRGLSFFLPAALRTGAKIANDVADGRPFMESAKSHVTDRINEYVPGLIGQSGSGRRRRTTTPRRRSRRRATNVTTRKRKPRRQRQTISNKRRKLSGIF